MTATTDPDARKAFVEGLRALARFLVSHSEVPVPAYTTSILLSESCAADSRGFVDTFAAMTGAQVDDRWDTSGHYHATRAFGPVEYEAYAISAPAMAAHTALSSYSGCVQPGGPARLGEDADESGDLTADFGDLGEVA
jgi:hypothetical protein